MSIAVPSMFVSTNDLVTVKNSLQSLLILQNSTGALPYAGVPFGSLIHTFSFTYHLYSLIGLNDYYLYTGDVDYLRANWDKFKLGLNYSLSMIDSSGMANVTTAADWLRFGMGGHNIEANAILYYTINLGLSLADVLNDTTVASEWSKYAADIKSAANARLWDASANLYRDNDTVPLTRLHPQDGNAWAIVSNLTVSQAQSANISTALAKRWGTYGAPAPEAGPTVSPFISGFELQAHYLAGQPQYAVQLIKRMWANFMLDDPRMTNSTFIEGYSTNGDLHYAPYTNDPRISHAHGWATGPTSALTFYAAGLQITSAVGKTWRIAPSPGGLTSVEAGFETSLGSFASNVTAGKGGMNVRFATPKGTTGGVSLQYPAADAVMTIRSPGGSAEDLVVALTGGSSGRVEVDGLPGGKYEVQMVSKT
jgi:hypothetical protein